MNILEEKKMDNGATVTITDQSRIMAGDRWLVKVVCEASLPVQEDFFNTVQGVEQGLLDAVREKMGRLLTFSVAKERIFVDAAEKDEVLKGLEEQVNANMLTYFNTPSFPQKLFAKRFAEVKEECFVAMHYEKIKKNDADDDEPHDFSACFKD